MRVGRGMLPLPDQGWNTEGVTGGSFVGDLKIGWLATHEMKDPISSPRPRPRGWTHCS